MGCPVCEKVLETCGLVVCVFDVPLETLLYFVSTLPREFTDYGGKSNLFDTMTFYSMLRNYY